MVINVFFSEHAACGDTGISSWLKGYFRSVLSIFFGWYPQNLIDFETEGYGCTYLGMRKES